MAKDSAWIKAQAEYRAGATLASICKKYKVTMRELLKRIQAEGWSRAGEEPKASVPSTEVKERNDRINDAIDEALADIIQGHRSISREMRTNLEDEIAEYQELKQYFVSALDKARIEELMGQTADGGENPALVDHLKKCLEAFAKRVQSLDKLVRLSALVVSTEREVWNIGANQDGKGDDASYDDLLELCRKPTGPRILPSGVADFERKLAETRGGL